MMSDEGAKDKSKRHVIVQQMSRTKSEQCQLKVLEVDERS